MIVDLRSDTVTRPTPAMREAIARAEVGDDVFGDDPTVNALQERIAGMLGKEAALFMPTGTQSNLCALMSHCQRGDEYIVGQMAHTYRWEAGGGAVLGSIQPQPIEQQRDGRIELDHIEAHIKPDDPHFARTRLVVLENTTGGQVLPTAYIAEVAQLARGRGLALHLDGARLFNAATANAEAHGTDVYDEARAICQHFDTASLCLSKGLGAPVGSLLLGRADAEVYPKLSQVLVYPGAFAVQASQAAAGGVVHEQRQVLAGQSWAHGQVVLGWAEVLAGAADMVSGVFRGTIWNETIPNALRGRLAGIEMISYLTGPLIGNARAGFMADAWGVGPAIWIGGLVCLAGVLATGFLLPVFWAYRSTRSTPAHDHPDPDR